MADAPLTDGRREKGRRRRRALLDATIRVIGRDGLAGVSQRVVAAEAAVPASAVAYYFPTVDELLFSVLADVNDRWIDAVERCRADPDPLGALARLITTVGDPATRAASAAEFELFLLAGRGERWGREYRRWTDALDAFFTDRADGITRDAASALVDGLLVRSYCDPADPSVVRAVLETVVRRG